MFRIARLRISFDDAPVMILNTPGSITVSRFSLGIGSVEGLKIHEFFLIAGAFLIIDLIQICLPVLICFNN
jgi:hypothetical protein